MGTPAGGGSVVAVVDGSDEAQACGAAIGGATTNEQCYLYMRVRNFFGESTRIRALTRVWHSVIHIGLFFAESPPLSRQ